MQIRLHGPSAEREESAELNDLLLEHLPKDQTMNQLAGSDMDLTMVLSDTGALTFVRYLQSDDFYRPTPEQFAESFMPNIDVGGTTTHQFLRDCSEGNIDVAPGDQEAVLRNWEDIVQSYGPLRSLRHENGPQDPQVKALTLAFAKKVVAFDGLLIRLKNRHPDPAISNRLAKAFTRYRLYAGQTAEMLDQTIRELLELHTEHPERFLPFPVGDAIDGHTDQRIAVNTPIERVLSTLQQRYELDLKIVTASPLEVAEAIMRHSAYRDLGTTADSMLTTRLERGDDGLFTGRLDGEMMAGIRKRQMLEAISAEKHRKMMVALGDLPGSDAQMGALSLSEGGVFVVAHRQGKFAESRNGFDSALEKIMGRKNVDAAKERIWYVEDEPTNGSTPA